MARSEVIVSDMDRNADNAVTKDAYDIANGHYIDINDVQDEDLTIFIEASDTKAATIVVKSGDQYASIAGDLEITTGAAGLHCLELESARFKDNDGYILIDITSAAGAAGNIFATKKY